MGRLLVSVLTLIVIASVVYSTTAACSSFQFDLTQPLLEWDHYWERCVGSGHALLGLRSDWQRDLQIVHTELGFQYVRFHAILDDDMSVFEIKDGAPYYSYYNIDTVYDYITSIGMKPVVELGFMPEAMAKNQSETVFHYKAITSPPADWNAWTSLVRDFVTHLIARYSLAEVATWYFEVWNEPNCGFWSGSTQEYFYLLQITSQTIHSVHPSLQVGGPATCQSQLIQETMNFINNKTISLDFISTHLYPTDFQPVTVGVMKQVISGVRNIVGNMPLFYTEYNDGLYANPPYHDTTFASAFIIKNIVDVQGLVELFSWWTFTDIFEEGGQESEIFSKRDGWGLLSLYDIRKPSFRAFQLLHETGNKRVPGGPAPDFFPTLGSIATTNTTHVTILIWNHNVPDGPITVQTVCVSLKGYKNDFNKMANVRRIDQSHANPVDEWTRMGFPVYLTQDQIQRLKSVSEMVAENITYTYSDQLGITFQLDIPPQGVAAIVVPLPN